MKYELEERDIKSLRPKDEGEKTTTYPVSCQLSFSETAGATFVT